MNLKGETDMLVYISKQNPVKQLYFVGMKRLKVPPLSEKQEAGTTFSLGFFLGTFLVLAAVIVLTW